MLAYLLRNIYDSIISGYLYHLEGKECWLDWYGNDGSWDTNLFPSYHTKRWMRYIDILSQRTRVYDTLCHCLANSTEEDGIRVYIDWVFHAFMERHLNFGRYHHQQHHMSMVEAGCVHRYKNELGLFVLKILLHLR